jgi:hypothetical protein
VSILGASVVFLVLLRFATDPYPSPSDYFGLVLLCALVAIWCVARRSSVGRGALVVSLAWLSVSTLAIAVASSRAPEVSFDAVVVIAIAIVVFVFVAFGGLEVNDIVGAFVLVVSVMAIDVLYESIRHGVTWFETMDLLVPEATWTEKLPVSLPRESFSALSHNYTAMIGAMALPLTIFLWAVRSVPRWLVGTSLLLILGMILATGSRGGWIASAVAALVAILGVAWLRAPDQWRRAARWSSLAIGALTLVFLGFYLAGFRPGFLFRGTLEDRLPVMRAGWEMFLDRPWFGHGPGSFPWLVDSYLGSTYPGMRARVVWNNAHNGYIGLLAEVGAVGALIIAGSALAVVVLAFRGARRDEGLSPIQFATLGSMAAFGLHSLIEVPFLGLAPIGFGAAVVGLIVTQNGVRPGRARPHRFAAGGVAILVGLSLVVGSSDTAGIPTGVTAMWRGDWASAGSAMKGGPQADGSILLSRLRTLAALEQRQEVSLDQVREEAKAEPISASAWLNLIEAEARSGGDYRKTLDALVRSIPYEEVAMLQAASWLDRVSDREGADRLYRLVLRMNPWLAESEYWSHLEDGPDRVKEIYRDVVASEGCDVADEFVLMEAWDTSMSRLFPVCPKDGPAAIAVALFEGDIDAAGAVLETSVNQTPDDPSLRRLAGLAAILDGRERDARRHWAIAALLGDGWATWQLAVRYQDALPFHLDDLLRENFRGYSPVLRGLSPESVYHLDSARVGSVFRVLGPPSTLVNGAWVNATTRIHDEILILLGLETQ